MFRAGHKKQQNKIKYCISEMKHLSDILSNTLYFLYSVYGIMK